MIIDKEKLISLLVDKTSLEQEQVEEQLSELVSRIQQAAQEGKSFEIEGFGTFRMEDDNLQFEPSNTLETEINNKYAGMKPIELIGAFKQPESEEIPDMMESEEDEKRAWAFDEESAKDKTSETEEKAKKPEEEIVASDQEETSSSEEPEESEIPKETEEQTLKDTPSEEEKAPIPEEEAKENEEAEKIEEKQPVTTGSREKVNKQPPKRASRSKPKGDPIGRFLTVAVILIAIGVGGWAIYDFGISGTQNAKPNNQVSSDQPAQKQMAKQQVSNKEITSGKNADNKQSSGTGKNSEPEQNLKVTKQGEGSSKSKASPKQNENDTYGLHGTVNHSISSGYTIVVHSLRSQKKAENNRQRLQDEGFRAMIQTAEVNGSLHYRVGIGQFPTVGAAEQAVKKLPEPYKSNHFIKRIKQQ